MVRYHPHRRFRPGAFSVFCTLEKERTSTGRRCNIWSLPWPPFAVDDRRPPFSLPSFRTALATVIMLPDVILFLGGTGVFLHPVSYPTGVPAQPGIYCTTCSTVFHVAVINTTVG